MPVRFHLTLIALLTAGLGAGLAASFDLTERPEEIPEYGPVMGYILQAGSRQFAFIPPGRWMAKTDPEERRVTITAREQGAFITLKFHPALELAPQGKLNLDLLRKRLATLYPDSKIAEEFPCYTGGGQGTGFDLEFHAKPAIPMAACVAFVPYPDWVVEINIAGQATQFKDNKSIMGGFMNSFRLLVDASGSGGDKGR